MTQDPRLDATKKEHDAKLAETQKLQAQLNGINQQMQELDKKRQEVTATLNAAATRAVELQGVLKFLEPEAAKAEAPAEAHPEAPAPAVAPETPVPPA